MINKDKYYKTSNFPLAATLISLGFSVKVLDKTNPRRVVFCFTNSKNIDPIVSDYWSNDLAVSPKDFYSAQKEIKSRLYEVSHES